MLLRLHQRQITLVVAVHITTMQTPDQAVVGVDTEQPVQLVCWAITQMGQAQDKAEKQLGAQT